MNFFVIYVLVGFQNVNRLNTILHTKFAYKKSSFHVFNRFYQVSMIRCALNIYASKQQYHTLLFLSFEMIEVLFWLIWWLETKKKNVYFDVSRIQELQIVHVIYRLNPNHRVYFELVWITAIICDFPIDDKNILFKFFEQSTFSIAFFNVRQVWIDRPYYACKISHYQIQMSRVHFFFEIRDIFSTSTVRYNDIEGSETWQYFYL